MFFRSPQSLIFAAILILIGSVQLIIAGQYADSAKREKTTVGVISHVSSGRGRTYDYVFSIDGTRLEDDSGTCRTALTPQGCKVGAQVLVYYAHNPVLATGLQEFGSASREKLIFGVTFVGCGLLLICLHFIFKRALRSPDESDDVDLDRPEEPVEIIHVVPGK